MNTIKIILAESGRTAELLKDFPLYKGQYNNKLLNILVPTSILAPQFDIQHYIGQMSGAVAPSTAELDAFVEANTYPERESSQGDIIEFYNTTSTNYYLYEFDGDEWVATQVNSFGTFTTLAGTSVKVGMIAVKRDGKIYESKSYFLRYLKTLTYQGTEYALYERKLPKEFTAIAGQGENAPTIVSNVVNVDTQTNEILSLITSQTCKLDVMMSTILDQDEPVEASDLETLEAEVNENSAKIALKQDKIDNGLLTTQKSVVGGINEIKNTADTNTSNISNNTQDIVDIKAEQITQNENISTNTHNISTNTENIGDLQTRVGQLEQQTSTEETYIGQMTGSTLPTSTQLNAFVLETAGRETKGGDVIIFIQTIPDATDKVYKYKYSGANQSWSYYEIPATEPASNTSKGILKGSYSSGTTQKTQVNVINGEIEDIYVVDNDNEKRRLAEYLNTDHSTLANTASKALQNEQDIATQSGKVSTLETSMANVLNGTTAVGKATKADQDGLGNNIAQTYLTTNAGVTKTQMKDYALPRVFNDVNFFTDDGYSDTPPTDITPIYSLEKQAGIIGDFEIFSADKVLENVTFQLSNKNSYTDTIFVRANENCSVQFRLTTELYVNNNWVTANVELTDMVELTISQIKKVSFGSTFNSLDYSVTLESGDIIRQTLEVIVTTSSSITFDIFSNDIYPSTFYLNTTTTTILLESGKLGELPTYKITGAVDTLNNKVIFTLPNDSDISNNVQALFILGLPSNATITDDTKLELSYNSQTIQIFTPSTIGTNIPATAGSMSSKFAPNASMSGKWVFTGVFQVDGAFIDLIADIDDLSTKANTSTIADAFSTSNTYAVGDIVIYDNTLYICSTAVTTAGTWDSSKWTATSVKELLALKANSNQVVRLDTNTDIFTNLSYKRLKSNYGFYFQAVNNDNRLEILPSSGIMDLYYYLSRYIRLNGTGLFDSLYNTYMNFPKASKNGYLILNTDLFSTFSTSSTYNVGDVVYYATNGTAGFYKCTTAVSTAGAWNSANWTAVTLKNLLAEYSKNDYIALRLNSEIEITDSNEIQITGLRTASSNIHNNSLIFDDTNYDKVTIGAGVSAIKVTSIIQYRQASDVTRFGNIVKKNGADFSNRGSYVGQSSDLTGTTLSSSERRVVVNNSFISNIAEGDVITFHAKSTGATSSAKDKITSQDAQTHFIIEVVK